MPALDDSVASLDWKSIYEEGLPGFEQAIQLVISQMGDRSKLLEYSVLSSE